MKIAIVGAGGVGGYFGARLAAAGEDVWFIARGAHLDAMRQQRPAGLQRQRRRAGQTVQGHRQARGGRHGGRRDGRGEAVVHAGGAGGREADGGPEHRGRLVPERRRSGGPDRAGLRARAHPGRRGQHRGGDRKARRHSPHRHHGRADLRRAGRDDLAARAGPEPRPAPAPASSTRPATTSTKAIWEKYVFLVAASAMTSLTRLPLGPIREDPDTRALTAQIMSEVAAVGRAKRRARSTPTWWSSCSRAWTACRARWSPPCWATWSAATAWSCPGCPAVWSRWASKLGMRHARQSVRLRRAQALHRRAPGGREKLSSAPRCGAWRRQPSRFAALRCAVSRPLLRARVPPRSARLICSVKIAWLAQFCCNANLAKPPIARLAGPGGVSGA